MRIHAYTVLLLALVGPVAAGQGTLDGVVINGTHGQPASAGTEVILRGWLDGQLATLAKTTTDVDGSFRFTELPRDSSTVYLPGANQGGVHFPGRRVRFDPKQDLVSVRLVVYDSISDPNPLVIDSHEVDISEDEDSLRVREVMTVRNPTQTCYVGKAAHAGGLPVTLRLSIPSTFSRVTFDKEAFGRRFRVINDSLVTDLPWPPGSRELSFSYRIPCSAKEVEWHRLADLPTSEIFLKVHRSHAGQIQCNLPRCNETAAYLEYCATNRDSAAEPIQLLFQDARPTVGYSRHIAVLLLLGMMVIVGLRNSHFASRSAASGRLGRSNRPVKLRQRS